MVKKAEQPGQAEFPEMVFMPIQGSAWRKFLISTPIDGDVMYEVWIVPVTQTRDRKFYQCTVQGGEHDGKVVTVAASLLNHLPYERLPEDGVSNNG